MEQELTRTKTKLDSTEKTLLNIEQNLVATIQDRDEQKYLVTKVSSTYCIDLKKMYYLTLSSIKSWDFSASTN